MKKILPAISRAAEVSKRLRFRPWRGSYASSTEEDIRDLYWKAIGVPATDPMDFIGWLRTSIGTYVENAFADHIFCRTEGWKLLGRSIPVGESSPAWDGLIDFLFETDDGQTVVLEMKTASGYGGNQVAINPTTYEKAGYFQQLGLYLRGLKNTGGVDARGILFVVVLSDSNFGTMVEFHTHYNKDKDALIIDYWQASDGRTGMCDRSVYELGPVLEKMGRLEAHVAKSEEPTPEMRYKYPVTPSMLESVSDENLKKMIGGSKIFGDWQVLYSQYKTKILSELPVEEKTYTPNEISMMVAEYKRRHPRSKITGGEANENTNTR